MSVTLPSETTNPWSEWLKEERKAGLARADASPSFDEAGNAVGHNAVWSYATPGNPFTQSFSSDKDDKFTSSPEAYTRGDSPFGVSYASSQGGIDIRPGTDVGALRSQLQEMSGGIFDETDLNDVLRNMGYSNTGAWTQQQALASAQQKYKERWDTLNADTSGNASRNPWDAINGRFGAGGGTGQSWSGNWFDDPANSQLETVIKNQLNQLTNPGAQDPQSQLMGFLMKRFQELSTSNGYSPEELALLNTQGLEPIEALRKSAQQRELERTASRGFLPTSGLTRLNQQQNDVDYDRMRTAASRDLAVQNVNERTNRLNQALQLGQTALNTQRGTNTNQLQLATLLQQMPRQAMLDALNVFSQSGSPDSLAGLVSQITSNANRDSYLNQQQSYGFYQSMIEAALRAWGK